MRYVQLSSVALGPSPTIGPSQAPDPWERSPVMIVGHVAERTKGVEAAKANQ